MNLKELIYRLNRKRSALIGARERTFEGSCTFDGLNRKIEDTELEIRNLKDSVYLLRKYRCPKK